jgi:hypothetical protein
VDVNDQIEPGGLIVRPGDTLILRVKGRQTDEEIECLRADIEKYLPGVKVAIFESVEEMAVYRPESTDQAE